MSPCAQSPIYNEKLSFSPFGKFQTCELSNAQAQTFCVTLNNLALSPDFINLYNGEHCHVDRCSKILQ